MKTLSTLTVFLLLFFFSCSRNSAINMPEVTYEVITSNSSMWFGLYFDKTGANTAVPYSSPVQSGWRLTFRPTHQTFLMHLQAYIPPDLGNPTLYPPYPIITINFYVNGQLVKTVSSSALMNGVGLEYIL